MVRKFLLALLSFTAAGFVVPRGVHAQSGDAAAAEALFRRGRELMDKGEVSAACEKFEASLALDVSAGTLVNLANCHDKAGLIAHAWAEYKQSQGLISDLPAGDRKRQLSELAAAAVAALEPRLPKMRLFIPLRPAGLKIARDGVEVPRAAWNETVPVDPGTHEFIVTAPGHKELRRSVTIEEGKSITVDLRLERLPDVAPEQAPASPAASAKAPSPAPPTPEPPAHPPLWVWMTGGAGLALGAGAVVTSLQARSRGQELDDKCGTAHDACDPAKFGGSEAEARQALADLNSAKTSAMNLTYVLGGLGAAALRTAVTGYFLTQPSDERATAGAWIVPGAAGAMIAGRW